MRALIRLFGLCMLTWLAVQGLPVSAQRPEFAPQPLLGVGPGPGVSGSDALFDDSVLHEIRLTVNTRDWQALREHYLEDTYYPADFRWRTQVSRGIGIRSRGTGSRSGTKPGLRVDFDRYSSDQTFLGLKSIVLRNNVQDPSNLHERLSMLFFRRLNLAAPREAHTTLFVNDEYVGLYTIVEAVDKAFLKRTVGEDNGYLFDYDYPPDAEPYYFENRGTDPARYVPLPFKPETHERDPRPEFIVQLVQAINTTSDVVFRGAVGEYLDLVQFLRHVAVEMFLADDDGFLGDFGMNNFYLHRFDNQKRFVFIAWDKSNAFVGGPERSIWKNVTDAPGSRQNRLMARVLTYPDLFGVYLDALVECERVASTPAEGATGGPGWLEREIEREYTQIRSAALADPLKPFTNAQFEEAIGDLRVFARTRGAAVMREVRQAQAATLRAAGVRAPGGS